MLYFVVFVIIEFEEKNPGPGNALKKGFFPSCFIKPFYGGLWLFIYLFMSCNSVSKEKTYFKCHLISLISLVSDAHVGIIREKYFIVSLI